MAQTFTDPELGRNFLRNIGAVVINTYADDTHTRTCYEYIAAEGKEYLVVRESKLEEPEYYYCLNFLEGKPSYA